MAKTNWQIEILNPSLGGYAPRFWAESYPNYGNKNQAGAMLNMDLTNAGFLTQGPGLAAISDGQTSTGGHVSTLIRGLQDSVDSGATAFAIGGNLLYYIDYNSGTIKNTNDANFPHVIDKGAVTGETGEDVCSYLGFVFYSYNHSGSAGDVGKCTPFSTFDDDYMSTVPSGAGALTSAPHQMKVGGNNVMYIANGRYVASFDGTTFIAQALDLPTGYVISSIAWMSDRLWIAANNPTDVGLPDRARASIFIWDGTTDSWESEIKLSGNIGALRVRNGVMYFFYKDSNSNGGFKLAYVDGLSVKDLASYNSGAVSQTSLPAYYQVSDYKDFLLFISTGLVYAYGSGDQDLPARFFQFCDAGFATVGGMGSPFGVPLIASYDGASDYKVVKLSGYETTANWKSLNFDVTNDGQESRINRIRLNFETLASSAQVNISLVSNQGVTLFSDRISYAAATATNPRHSLTSAYLPLNGIQAENFRVELSFTSGSTTNPVKIRNIKIYGTSE